MDPLEQVTNCKYCLLILHRENQLQPRRVHLKHSVILRENKCKLFISQKEAATLFKATILDEN